MRALIGVELGVAVVEALFFIAIYLRRSPWHGSPLGRHFIFLAAALALAFGLLLLVTVAIRVPGWVFGVGFAAVDLVLARQIVLLVRIQEETDAQQ